MAGSVALRAGLIGAAGRGRPAGRSRRAGRGRPAAGIGAQRRPAAGFGGQRRPPAGIGVRRPGPARLTRRGRLVLLGLLLLLATVLTGFVAARGEASVPAGTPATVVVRPGDTLWSIAQRYAPARDPFETIDEIRRLNGITDYTVRPGQRLIIPRR
jgi:LysM repeat protein